MDEIKNGEMQGDAQLISCPICGSANWSGLRSCHVCGYPFADDVKGKRPPAPSRKKFKKAANGRGSVQCVAGHLRKPYKAVVTVGHEVNPDTGQYHQIRKCLGYYATEAEARAALDAFTLSPYDVDSHRLTFSQVYKMYMDFNEAGINPATKRRKVAAYNRCAPLYDLPLAEIKPYQIQALMDSLAADDGCSYVVLGRVKALLSAVFEYGINSGICERDVTALVTIGQYKDRQGKRIERAVFTGDEVAALRSCAAKGDSDAETVLFLLATGLRVSEMYNLRCDDVDLKERTLRIRESKTQAGIRLIPYPDSLAPLVERYHSKGHEYLFTSRYGHQWADANYRVTSWQPLMRRLGMGQHRPHDTRHSYTSVLLESGASVPLVDSLIGHRSGSVTLDVYAHYSAEALRAAVNLAFPCDAP